MKNLLVLFCLSIFTLMVSCNASKNVSAPVNSIPNTPYTLMTGSFNSEAQSLRDTLFYNISLHMYPIWTNKSAQYLYVEQALATMQDKPYRQRIYKVTELPNGIFESVVYKLADEKSFIGKWNDTKYFDQFDESILEIREGCAVYLKPIGKQIFEGSTKEKDCKSTLRGATYATSVVRVEKDKIVSWDQGFDASGKQVWGAETEGYIFDRLK